MALKRLSKALFEKRKRRLMKEVAEARKKREILDKEEFEKRQQLSELRKLKSELREIKSRKKATGLTPKQKENLKKSARIIARGAGKAGKAIFNFIEKGTRPPKKRRK